MLHMRIFGTTLLLPSSIPAIASDLSGGKDSIGALQGMQKALQLRPHDGHLMSQVTA